MKMPHPDRDTADRAVAATRGSAADAIHPRSAAGDSSALQAAVDGSPRIASQRRVIDALFPESGTSGNRPAPETLQRKIALSGAEKQFLKPNILRDFGLHLPAHYADLFTRLDSLDKTFSVSYGSPGQFTPADSTIQVPQPILGAVPTFGTLDASQRKNLSITVSHMAHEMQHAADYVIDGKTGWTGDAVPQREKYLAIMETELRAWATEAMVLKAMAQPHGLIEGWATFDDYLVTQSDDQLKANEVWARIIQYGTKNGHLKQDADDRKTCWRKSFLDFPEILVWAKAWARQVREHREDATPRGPVEEVLVDSDATLSSPALKAFREGGQHIWKVRKDADFAYYSFESKLYKVRKSLGAEFGTISGSWPA